MPRKSSLTYIGIYEFIVFTMKPASDVRRSTVRRSMARATALLLIAACAGLPVAAQTPVPTATPTSTATAPGEPAAVRAQQVADNVWLVQGQAAAGSAANRNFISNAAFVVTAEGVLVVDALGAPVLARELLAEIRRVTPAPLRYVVLTHYHADHIYGLQELKAAGAEVLAHAKALDYLASDAARQRLDISRQELAPWVDMQTRLVAPDRALAGDTTLELGGERIHLLHAGPAHTAEDVVVWVERSGVLIVGDLVFRGRLPFVGQADSRAWVAALDRLLERRPQVLVPGHGPASRDAAQDLREARDYLAYLRQSMGRAVAELEPFDEAYARTDWSRFEGLPLFRLVNRMNAYNTYLLLEQESVRK
jgi:glyoxylase-like metal-dependent hydrolase (beta-lactamase superfamily II)